MHQCGQWLLAQNKGRSEDLKKVFQRSKKQGLANTSYATLQSTLSDSTYSPPSPTAAGISSIHIPPISISLPSPSVRHVDVVIKNPFLACLIPRRNTASTIFILCKHSEPCLCFGEAEMSIDDFDVCEGRAMSVEVRPRGYTICSCFCWEEEEGGVPLVVSTGLLGFGGVDIVSDEWKGLADVQGLKSKSQFLYSAAGLKFATWGISMHCNCLDSEVDFDLNKSRLIMGRYRRETIYTR
ncbi:hypothetical protein K491DRAFT_693209 [Lophiostoma macrostomum CBS 122681]|uniref:Uncharacterized protein n=1 Tax=Lophiostoma macrostomum CBS 122681 TaxID=1314788 RepID=A0A6A6T5B8_9PLEO|nr:hypothetical protein K491DRAFT_693209 [Lophiostoma macrostomum CBS 122681]